MELRRTIKGCDANWTMTISVDPLEPDEDEEPTEVAKVPDFPTESLRVLEHVFLDAINLYEYQRDAGTGHL